MRAEKLKRELHAALGKADPGSSKAAVIDRLLNLIDALSYQVEADSTPERTRSKMLVFLESLEASHGKVGGAIAEPAFALNVVGEAMIRSALLHESVIDFLKVGLYFYALDQIERRWAPQAAVYTSLHADLVMSYVGRRNLKDVIKKGEERLASGRVFCLTYHYLNALKKEYWKHRRASEDALDRATVPALDQDQGVLEASGTRQLPAPDGSEETLPAGDRLRIMFAIFREALSSEQQWIYLAKNRHLMAQRSTAGKDLDAWIAGGSGALPESELNWKEIACRLGINEKTAKREYLRALDIILRSSAQVVFGDDWVPVGFVKRVLDQLRTVIRQKDLRIRSSTGRGLNALVEKWEVALRFVLNHQRVSA